jgi:5-hydroxyisourate hydrolase-like protein (transthyretin family)
MVTSPRPAEDRSSTIRRIVTIVSVVVSLVLGPLALSPARAAVAGSISGTVVDSTTGAPVLAATVHVRPADDDDASPITADANDGVFTVPGLSPGAYTVEFRDVSGEHLAEFYDDTTDITEATLVAVGEGTDTSLGDIGLDQGASLSGVVETAVPSGPDGGGRTAVAGATVTAIPVGGQTDPQDLIPTTTDADGTYSLTHLPAGTYKVRVSAPDYFDAYSGGAATEQDAVDKTVSVGEIASIDSIVLDRAASVTGSVTDETGEPLESVVVDAYPVVKDVVAAQSAARSSTDRNGIYAFPRLRAGSYRLAFSAGSFLDRFDTEVTIEGGESPEIEPVALSRAPIVAPVVPPGLYAPPVPVAKKVASVKVRAKGGKKKATLTITVKASNVTPTGKITIRVGSKKLKTVTLRRGTAKVTLTKQKKGKRAYTIIYSGDSRVRAKTVSSKKIAIK